jgi:hypothetical protein
MEMFSTNRASWMMKNVSRSRINHS